jgi:hypothetical protein
MIDPITQYILEKDSLLELQNIGYMGKYSGKTTEYIINQMGKDPNGLSFLRFTRGQTVMGAKIAAAVGAVIIIGVSIKLFKRYMTKVGRACKGYKPSSVRYKRCSYLVKIASRKKQIEFLNTKIKLCKDTKDPNKCKAKTQEYINKVKTQISKLETKKNEVAKKIPNNY